MIILQEGKELLKESVNSIGQFLKQALNNMPTDHEY